MRLLDIGCGWGSLAVHAAREHRVRVTAVTLSAEQADHVRARVGREGLDDLVEVELRHYRDIASGGYDAVTAIETGSTWATPRTPISRPFRTGCCVRAAEFSSSRCHAARRPPAEVPSSRPASRPTCTCAPSDRP